MEDDGVTWLQRNRAKVGGFALLRFGLVALFILFVATCGKLSILSATFLEFGLAHNWGSVILLMTAALVGVRVDADTTTSLSGVSTIEDCPFASIFVSIAVGTGTACSTGWAMVVSSTTAGGHLTDSVWSKWAADLILSNDCWFLHLRVKSMTTLLLRLGNGAHVPTASSTGWAVAISLTHASVALNFAGSWDCNKVVECPSR
jgi:hypothetical protein